MLEVKPLIAHEWPVLKQVRLRALADAPDAFCTTLAQAQSYSDTDWQARAGRFAADPPAAARIAYWHGTPCGMMTCYPAALPNYEEGPAAELTAVWVDPAVRGQGVAETLVASVVDWAVAQSMSVLQAWVMEENHRALAFYRKAGFSETGRREPDEPDTTKYIVLLARRLGAPGVGGAR